MTDDHEQLMRALHDEHGAALWGYCLHLTDRDPVRAQDVCQETLVRAWQHPEVFARTPSAARGWLFTVARNIVIDEWRARKVRPETVMAEPPDARAEQDRVDQLLDRWVLAEAMATLSEDHRRVLFECYFQGRSVADAAGRLGVPAGTVKSRAHYALRALRLALEELGVTG
ncbi:sigma-70 family RNA polymerase sigma factor [Nocardioides sp. YIM 152588]|uniref:sigma-70 family RNA polymerase sigma factor n=1 Tax=Nocardioides sp. YIM 152588 TaxID=3158259 RepID=UPI0032E38FB4